MHLYRSTRVWFTEAILEWQARFGRVEDSNLLITIVRIQSPIDLLPSELYMTDSIRQKHANSRVILICSGSKKPSDLPLFLFSLLSLASCK